VTPTPCCLHNTWLCYMKIFLCVCVWGVGGPTWTANLAASMSLSPETLVVALPLAPPSSPWTATILERERSDDASCKQSHCQWFPKRTPSGIRRSPHLEDPSDRYPIKQGKTETPAHPACQHSQGLSRIERAASKVGVYYSHESDPKV
jgi:hypothetical protein